MKFCLTDNCSPEYLSQADEIKTTSTDEVYILELLKKYPNATIILLSAVPLPFLLKIKDRIKIATTNPLIIEEALSNSIPVFYYQTIPSFFNLNKLAAKGITEFYPGINIFFNQYSIPTTLTQRIIPNESLESAHGPWLIPQSLHLYPEQTVIEFNTSTPKEEEALFRIYSSNEWVGSLKTIIPDFPSKEAKASLILPEVPIYRLSCGQICERSPGRCRLCDRAVLTAELSYKEEEAD